MTDNPRSERLQNGTIFKSRYEITGFLGEGGFASVYRAKDVEIGREVAIKILHILATTMTDPTTHVTIVERFRQEARTAAQIKHPAVVTIFDVGMTDDNHPYIIMDLLDGHDLEHELENFGPMQLSRALPLFSRCLEALAEAHRLGIVHKDLKPSNLYMLEPNTPRESIAILDFGIARVTEDNDARLTSAGQILGTPRYMAPEYIDSQVVSPATDVYQMGLILIEMLTGTPVVSQETLISCIMVHANGVEIPEELLGTPLEPILRKATARDPDERIPDCTTFLDMLVQTDFSSMGLPNAAMAISRLTSRLPALEVQPPGPSVVKKSPDKSKGSKARTSGPASTPAESSGGGKGGATLVVGALVALLVLAGVGVAGGMALGVIPNPMAKAATDKGEQTTKDDTPKGGDSGQDKDPLKEGKAHMEEADWDKAVAAFDRALEKDKGDKEARKLKEQAEKEKDNAKLLEQASKDFRKGKIERGLERLAKIPEDSHYADKVQDARKKGAEHHIEEAREQIKKDPAKAAEALALAASLDENHEDIAGLRKKLPKGGVTVAVKGALKRGIDQEGAKAALAVCKVARAKGEKCSARLFAAEQPDKIFGMKPFQIDQFEVTNESYEACVKTGKCQAARYSTTCGGEDPSIKGASHPVVCVTYDDAVAFCKWADKRLPTEAEWEMAARGANSTQAFPWGSKWEPKFSNWGDVGGFDKQKFTAPVGSYSKDVSPFKVHDMGGNVSEWTLDGFSNKFYREDVNLNPVNTKDTKTRTVRGGNWQSGGHTTRTTWRQGVAPDAFRSNLGFRCAK